MAGLTLARRRALRGGLARVGMPGWALRVLWGGAWRGFGCAPHPLLPVLVALAPRPTEQPHRLAGCPVGRGCDKMAGRPGIAKTRNGMQSRPYTAWRHQTREAATSSRNRSVRAVAVAGEAAHSSTSPKEREVVRHQRPQHAAARVVAAGPQPVEAARAPWAPGDQVRLVARRQQEEHLLLLSSVRATRSLHRRSPPPLAEEQQGERGERSRLQHERDALTKAPDAGPASSQKASSRHVIRVVLRRPERVR